MLVVCWEVGGVEHVATDAGWMKWAGGVDPKRLPEGSRTFATWDAAFDFAASLSRNNTRRTYPIELAPTREPGHAERELAVEKQTSREHHNWLKGLAAAASRPNDGMFIYQLHHEITHPQLNQE